MTHAATCTVFFDGKPLTGPVGRPLVDFLADHGIDVPHVCYHRALGPLETCDVCWVDINGEMARACAQQSQDGMRVQTSPLVLEAREEGMDRLLAKHELYCTVCEHNTGDCTLHNTMADMDIPIQRYEYRRSPYDKDESNPFYTYDPDQCILCGRCVQACQNVQVNETLSIDFSQEFPRVLWDGGHTIDGSSCVSCGHCVTVCPCNALLEKSMQPDAGPFTSMSESVKRPLIDIVKTLERTIGATPVTAVSNMDMQWRQPEIKRTKTVCTYCGVGCSFEIWTRNRHILKVQPVVDAPTNGISTCIKGKFAWDFVNSGKRLTTPLIRENDSFREASWDEALDLVAQRLMADRARYGPDAIGFIGSSKASNEEAYLTQKIARLVIGTNNVDNSSRYCQNPATKGLFRTVGYGGDAGTLEDIAQADLVVIVGSNLAENHPVFATRVKQAGKLRGQKLIVIDPRKHEMAERADIYLRVRPGTDLIWASAFSRYMFEHGYADLEFLQNRVNQVAAYRASLDPFTMEFAAQMTEIPQETLVAAAEMIGQAKSVCLLWAMGITQHSHGSDTSTAFSNLLLVTGNYGRAGTGGYPMRGHNNVQGASDFGCLKNFYPGYEKVDDEAVRRKWAQAWGVEEDSLSLKVGADNFTMVQDADTEKIRAMYVIGEETALSDSHTNDVHDGFEKLEFLVVQDMFMSRTAQFADVILPACASLEKDGTFVNTERRIQRFYPAFPPLGESRPDWQILTELARRMGHDWAYEHPSEIMEEVAGIAEIFRGVSYERLEGWNSQCWPVNEDGSDTPLLYTERFNTEDGKAVLYPLEWSPPQEDVDEDYPLMLDNGRMLEHFQATNQTGRNDGIDRMLPEWFVEISPELAQEHGIADGSVVRLSSRRDSVDVPVLVTDRVAGRVLFLPLHQGKPGLNLLTGEHHDPVVNTPAYKETAVRMTVLDPAPKGSPLPKSNFRFARRTPVSGVEVEVKWAQPNYVVPPAQQLDPEKL